VEEIDAAKMLELMHEDLLVLVQRHAVPCTGRDEPGRYFRLPEGHLLGCHHLATVRVRWSDREMEVCKKHLPYAKWCAANDGSGDRTDDPLIDGLTPDDIVKRHWPKVLKLATKPGTTEPFPITVIDLSQDELQESIDTQPEDL